MDGVPRRAKLRPVGYIGNPERKKSGCETEGSGNEI
jgi:hypothetical protein